MKALALTLLLCFAQASQLKAQASFFEGKTIRIVVGLPAGDAYDLYPRMLANYMGNTFPAIGDHDATHARRSEHNRSKRRDGLRDSLTNTPQPPRSEHWPTAR